jgi:hypothetical protein
MFWKQNKQKLFFLIIIRLSTRAFNMSNSETNLLKFELGISNESPSLLNLPLVSGDNNFICRSSDAMARSDTSALSIQHYNVIFY